MSKLRTTGLATGLIALAISMWAAEAWQTKPYTAWSDRDASRVLNNSPWAREVRVTLPRSSSEGAGAPGLRRGGVDAASTSPIGGDTGMRGNPDSTDPSSRLERASGTDSLDAIGQGINLMVRWQSALPMRQAQMRLKFGAEVGASEQAKQFLAETQNVYVIGVYGLPAVQVGLDELKKDMLAQTSLAAKGKPPLRPIKVDLNTGAGSVAGARVMDVFFMFLKAEPFSAADKDVEFSTTVNATPVRCGFRLKDMIFAGELAL